MTIAVDLGRKATKKKYFSSKTFIEGRPSNGLYETVLVVSIINVLIKNIAKIISYTFTVCISDPFGQVCTRN